MDTQTRKLYFIQDFLKYANTNMLDKFEKILRQEREKEFEREINPMTINQYEQLIDKALEDIKQNRVKSVRALKN